MSIHSKRGISDFRTFIEDRMREWGIPGLAIGVIRDREVIFKEGFGNCDINSGTPVNPQSLFPIGSCTKAFTTTAISILVDDGILNWDTPVRSYIPDFMMNDPVATEYLTLRDIACHRSGLPRHDLSWYAPAANLAERVHRLRYLQSSHPFRTKFQYSNLMYMTTGHVIEQVTHEPWEEIVRRRIFEPLGLVNSNFSIHHLQQSMNHAQPYLMKWSNILPTEFLDLSAIGPAGSINSNIDDMLTWILLHLNRGRHGDNQSVSEQCLAETHTPHMVLPIPPGKNKEIPIQGYGLGWGVCLYRGYPLVWHNGGVDGFSSEVSFVPGENMGIVILANLEEVQQALSIVRRHIYDRMLGLSEIDWNERFKNHRSAEDRPVPVPLQTQATIPIRFLRVTYYRFNFEAHHLHDHVFQLVTDAHSVQGGDISTMGKVATFGVGLTGNANSISIRMEPDMNVGEIVFHRVLA